MLNQIKDILQKISDNITNHQHTIQIKGVITDIEIFINLSFDRYK
jgi:hypothetical protein